MNAREHVIISVATSTAAVLALKTIGMMQISDEAFITALVITAVGSLMPDVDHPDSTISRTSFGLMILGLVLYFLPAGMLNLPLPFAVLAWIQNQFPSLASWDYQQILGASLVLISLVTVVDSRLLPHRGLSHSLVCWLFETGGVYTTYKFFGNPYPGIFAVFFAWGILSHLVADCFTTGDAPDLFWPLSIDTDEVIAGIYEVIGRIPEEVTYSMESIWDKLDDIWFQIRLRWF
jgi:membrane-bound metal-dependent hydrolase YbcI (DUF457 family)